MIFKLVLKISAIGKHNVQLNSPHSNSWLPSYKRVEYFVNLSSNKTPTSVNENWKMENLFKWV